MHGPHRWLLGCLLALALGMASACATTPPGAGGLDGAAGGGQDGAQVRLASGTCWSATTLGQDPQTILAISNEFKVNYLYAARALLGRAAFARTRPCNGAHSIEVYKAVAMSDVQPQVADYGQLLEPQTAAYQQLSLQVDRACMNQTLFNVANATGINNTVVTPAFPDGMTLGWAPPSPEQWAAGQRVYACTLTQASPSALLYNTVFSGSFPTEDRTCIDNRALEYVDCARTHNRERIGLIDVQAAVATGQFPGAVRNGSVPVTAVLYQVLDRACTTYLKQVSDTTKLTGVAEIDPGQWPTRTGAYPVECEADTAPAKQTITTQGSVFDK
ncbi:MAG TPA: septum formation family protein [Marmoricola sp.]|jgi:hypothetical protein|nr:septum formation family protein [Marmoricola sp.]